MHLSNAAELLMMLPKEPNEITFKLQDLLKIPTDIFQHSGRHNMY